MNTADANSDSLQVEAILGQREYMLSGSSKKRELEEDVRSLESWHRKQGKPFLDQNTLGKSGETDSLLEQHTKELAEVKRRRQVG